MDPRGSGQMSDNYDFYVQEENQDSCDSWEERSSGRTRALAGKSTCYPKQVQENRFSPPWAAVSAPRDRHAGLYSPDCTVTYTAPSRSPVNTNSSSAFGSDKSNMGGNDNVSCFYRKNKLGMHSRDRSPIFPSQEDGEVNDIVQSGKSKRYLEDDCYGDSLFRPPLWTDSRDPMRDLPHSSLSSRPQQFRNSPIDRSEMGLHSQDEDSIGRRDYGRRDDTPERRSSPRTQEWSTRRGDLLKRSGSPRNQDWPKRRDNRPDTQDWPIARDYRLERSGSPRTQDWCVRRDDRPERSSSPRTQDWCARRDDKLERSGSPRTQDWSIRRDDRPERSGSPRTQDWSNRRKDRLKRSGSPRTQDWPKRRDDRPERNISPRTPNWSNRKTDNMEGNSSCRNQDWSERSGDRNREDWLEQIETDESDIRDRYNWQKEEWFNRRDDSSDKVDKWSFTRHQHFERTRSRDQLSERRDDNFDLFERRNYLAHDWQDRHEPDTSSRSERKEDRRETFDKTGNRFNRRDSDSFESSHYSRTGQLEGSESINSSLRRSYGTLSFDVEKEMFPPERMSSGNNYPPNNSAKNVTYSPIPSPPPPPVLSMSPLHGNQTTDYSKKRVGKNRKKQGWKCEEFNSFSSSNNITEKVHGKIILNSLEELEKFSEEAICMSTLSGRSKRRFSILLKNTNITYLEAKKTIIKENFLKAAQKSTSNERCRSVQDTPDNRKKKARLDKGLSRMALKTVKTAMVDICYRAAEGEDLKAPTNTLTSSNNETEKLHGKIIVNSLEELEKITDEEICKASLSGSSQRRFKSMLIKTNIGYTEAKREIIKDNFLRAQMTKRVLSKGGPKSVQNTPIRKKTRMGKGLSKVVLKTIKIAVVDMCYPAVLLKQDRLVATKKALVSAMGNIPVNDPQVRLLKCIQRPGFIVLTCGDAISAEWVKGVVPTLVPWEDASLRVLEGADIPKPVICTAFIPNKDGVNLSKKQILTRLRVSNHSLRTDVWVSFGNSLVERGQVWTFSIDNESLGVLKEMDMMPYFNIGRITFTLKKANSTGLTENTSSRTLKRSLVMRQNSLEHPKNKK